MNLRKILPSIIAAIAIHSCALATNSQADIHLSLNEPLFTPKIEDTSKKAEQAVTATAPAKSHDATRLSSRDRRLRKRKSKTKRHTISTMSFEELREAKNRKIAEKNIEIAIKYAEKMLPVCKDMHELKDLTIELADLYFQNGDLEKAGKLYNEFSKLYPGYDKIEHAEHKAILCSFYSILGPQNDQTKTKETIELTKKFLERSDVFIKYSGEVEKIQKQCYQRLVESEKNILEYYLNRGSIKSVQTRIENMRKDFGDIMPHLEPELLTYEIQIAQKTNYVKLVEQKQLELQEKFPNFASSVVLAQAEHGKKIDFTAKF